MRTNVRRRHRTWIFSMCMATLGWAVWWVTLVVAHFSSGDATDLRLSSWLAGAFAAIGFAAAIWGIRAKLAWILFMLIPMFANASLLAMPLVLKSMRFFDSGVHAQQPMDPSSR
jgi:hypothetical protein